MMLALDNSTHTDTSPNQQTLLQYTHWRPIVLPVLPEYTLVRNHDRVKSPPFSLIVIMIGPGSTKLRRVEL